MHYVAQQARYLSWKYHVSQLNIFHAFWSNKIQVAKRLDCMTRDFMYPYIIFYPDVAPDGNKKFPVNQFLSNLLDKKCRETQGVWRGDIIIVRCSNATEPFLSLVALQINPSDKIHWSKLYSLTDATIADFAVIKNYFLNCRAPPLVVCVLKHSSCAMHTTKLTVPGLACVTWPPQLATRSLSFVICVHHQSVVQRIWSEFKAYLTVKA